MDSVQDASSFGHADFNWIDSPRMGAREDFNPTLKNGDMHSNTFPLDFPMPTADTSATRP